MQALNFVAHAPLPTGKDPESYLMEPYVFSQSCEGASATITMKVSHMFELRWLIALTCFFCGSVSISAQSSPQVFGVKERSEGSLIGILYDLKQTQDRSKTEMTVNLYSQVIDEFLAKNLDDNVLDRFYRVTQPLYSTQIYIPMMGAQAAPKAFGAEKTVRPSMWLIHYKGQVVPPETGRFRFVGYADDWIAVAVNGKTALVASHPSMKFPKTQWKSPEKLGMKAGNGKLSVGDWIDFKKGVPFDVDIMMGERPGGDFCAFLMIEKEGGTYQTTSDTGHPILPIFQVVKKVVNPAKIKAAPPFSEAPSVWPALP